MLTASELLVEAGRLVRFGIVGALASIVYAGVTFLIVSAGLGGPLAATIVGQMAAGVVSYIGHLRYSFAVEPDHRVFLWRFIAVAIIAFAANILTTWLLTAVLRVSYIYAIVAVTVLIPIINYLCNRFWIFRSGMVPLASQATSSLHRSSNHDRQQRPDRHREMSQSVSKLPAAPAAEWPVRGARLHIAGLVLLFVVEGLVFYSQLASRIVPFHPVAFDQTGYFLETYRLLDAFHSGGWKALFTPILQPNSATGMTFTFQGALLGLIGGPNRTAIISLNLLYFLALLQSSSMAWMGLGLLLSLGTLFNMTGGIIDYRIDFSALCLYGIWTCLVIRSERFRDLRFALLITGVGVWLIALRFFTVAYLGLIFSGLLAFLVIAVFRTRDPAARKAAKYSARNLFISGTLTAALAFPFLFSVRQLLYVYYGIGHFFGSEKHIRAAENQIFNLYDHLMYYPNTLLNNHVGWPTLRLAAAVTVTAVILAVLPGWRSFARQLRGVQAYAFEFAALGLAICVPLILLTIDVAKSPVVGGIVVVPIILLVTVLCASLLARRGAPADPPDGTSALPVTTFASPWPGRRIASSRRVVAVGCSVVLAVGLAEFLRNAATEQREPSRMVRAQYVALNEAIVRLVFDNHLVRPKISFDRVADYLNVGTLDLYGYERYREFINYVPRFGVGGYGIFATPRDVAMQLIAECDIVILTDPILARDHPYPMNTKIKEYWGEMRQWASDNLVLTLTDNIAGVPYEVFAKPGFKVGGISGGWITSAGLFLEVNAAYLVRWPVLVLEGPTIGPELALLGGTPKPRATLVEGRDQEGPELPANLQFDGRGYTVAIDARTIASAGGERKKIKLTFDRNFVPSRVSTSADTRELVLRAPGTSILRADPPN
jgi:putative flippase GtrA